MCVHCGTCGAHMCMHVCVSHVVLVRTCVCTCGTCVCMCKYSISTRTQNIRPYAVLRANGIPPIVTCGALVMITIEKNTSEGECTHNYVSISLDRAHPQEGGGVVRGTSKSSASNCTDLSVFLLIFCWKY